MQEDCEITDGYVVTRRAHKLGQHIRNAGEDIAAGEQAVAQGQKIGMAELGLLASVGCEDILVRRTPKVTFFRRETSFEASVNPWVKAMSTTATGIRSMLFLKKPTSSR